MDNKFEKNKQRMNILFISDRPPFPELYIMNLGQNRDVHFAYTVDGAIKVMNSGEKFDLIVSEVLLVNETISEFLLFLEQAKYNIPIILFTSKSGLDMSKSLNYSNIIAAIEKTAPEYLYEQILLLEQKIMIKT